MFSGVFIISCITTPEFSRRFCSLLFSAKSGAVAIRPKHTRRIDLRIIADLHDQSYASADFPSPKHLLARAKRYHRTPLLLFPTQSDWTCRRLDICLVKHTLAMWFLGS